MSEVQCTQPALFDASAATKRCGKCGEEKKLADFGKRPSRPCGVTSKCKVCLAKTPRHIQDRKNEKRRLKRWMNKQAGNPSPKATESALKKRRFMHRKIKYKITKEEYEKLEKEQNGVCAICGRPQTIIQGRRERDLCVDHDHDTDCNEKPKVRGLLCHNCNVGIGNLKDSPELLRRALAYLERNGKA